MPPPPVGFVAHVRVSTYLYTQKRVSVRQSVSTTGYFLNNHPIVWALGPGGVKTYKSHDKSPCNMQES